MEGKTCQRGKIILNKRANFLFVLSNHFYTAWSMSQFVSLQGEILQHSSFAPFQNLQQCPCQ